MKNFSRIATVCCAFALLSCSRGADVAFRADDLPSSRIAVKVLQSGALKTIDTLKTDGTGKASIRLKVEEGQPQFVYFYRGETKLASILAFRDDRIRVFADSLGAYRTEGSPESDKLREVETAYGRFLLEMSTAKDGSDMVRRYVAYYRDCVKYLVSNPGSLTVVPLLFQQFGDGVPVFSQPSDAIHFRSACDSLKAVWPESGYVAALEKETVRRENAFRLENRLRETVPTSFPEIEMPDMKGERRSLGSLQDKVILVHFWDCSDPAQGMMNIEVLKPLYEKYSSRGLQIYSVCVTPDKAAWGAMVTAQKLGWINVNDGKGAVVAARSWNVTTVPATMIISNGEVRGSIAAGGTLEGEIEKLLK